jgi:tetratricopeptide (TPR) repeat protein
MNKKHRYLLLLLIPTVLILSGCSGLTRNNQLTFGIQVAQKNLWDEAIFRWKKFLEIKPNSAAAYNNLAVAYEKKGFWDEAEEAYESALRLNPDNKYIKSNYQNFKDRFKPEEKKETEKKKNEKK